MNSVKLTGVLLVLSAVTLALMIPGGFVETRSFARYPIWVLGAFNVVLTVLGLGSLVLAYRIFSTGYVTVLASITGFGFVCVYGLDLLHVFPISDNPMSFSLYALEWLGTLLGLLLAGVAWNAINGDYRLEPSAARLPAWGLVVLGLMTVVVVVFATWFAR